jgi:hypothetical protein
MKNRQVTGYAKSEVVFRNTVEAENQLGAQTIYDSSKN